MIVSESDILDGLALSLLAREQREP
jgi:hypothetical protein